MGGIQLLRRHSKHDLGLDTSLIAHDEHRLHPTFVLFDLLNDRYALRLTVECDVATLRAKTPDLLAGCLAEAQSEPGSRADDDDDEGQRHGAIPSASASASQISPSKLIKRSHTHEIHSLSRSKHSQRPSREEQSFLAEENQSSVRSSADLISAQEHSRIQVPTTSSVNLCPFPFIRLAGVETRRGVI